MKTEYIFENRITGKQLKPFILDIEETGEEIRDSYAITEVAKKYELNENDLILIKVFN